MQRKLFSVFKKRFEAEYITALQEKYIYNRPRFLQDNSIIVGDVVLIKKESIPRMKWRKGKIIELIRGNNGKIIGVKLNVYQTKLKRTVVINRPLQLIVPLEIAKATFFTLPLLNSVCDHSTNSICSFGSITMWF